MNIKEFLECAEMMDNKDISLMPGRLGAIDRFVFYRSPYVKPVVKQRKDWWNNYRKGF